MIYTSFTVCCVGGKTYCVRGLPHTLHFRTNVLEVYHTQHTFEQMCWRFTIHNTLSTCVGGLPYTTHFQHVLEVYHTQHTFNMCWRFTIHNTLSTCVGGLPYTTHFQHVLEVYHTQHTFNMCWRFTIHNTLSTCVGGLAYTTCVVRKSLLDHRTLRSAFLQLMIPNQ